MPVKRDYQPIPVSVTQARYLPDYPSFAIGLSDYTEKTNWERYKGRERKRAGWDYPAPTDLWSADMLGRFDADSPCEAIRGIRRPNNTYAIVGCGGGKIKAFSYDLNDWVTIGSGYSVDGDPGFLWWQIEDIDGYAVFNNGLDLLCSWQVGDAAVRPNYEFRESGYASCGHIVEYYGVLICANILEIDPTEMSVLMNGPDPYGTLVPSEHIHATGENLLVSPNDLTDPAWILTNNLITSNLIGGPAGGMVTASVLNSNTGGSAAHYAEQQIAIQSGELYVAQVYVRAFGASSMGRLVIGDPTLGVIAAQAEFTADGAGSVTVSALSGEPTDMSASIEAAENNWYLVTLVARLGGLTAGVLRLQAADASGQYVFAGGAAVQAWYGAEVATGESWLTRIGFERVWSNLGDPRDFAAEVAGSIEGYPEASFDLVLAWPMASLQVGDLIRILGAGTLGGNLTTTIAAIAGVYVTLSDSAETTVTDAQVAKETAFDSIVGSDELEGDGSTIIREMPLKNQLVSYKESGEIFQSYYTASVDQPFASQRMSGADSAKRPIRFPRTLVNVMDKYHLFAGAANFFQFQLSAQEAVQHPLFMGAETSAFFDQVTTAGVLKVFGADNTAVGQIYFAYPMGPDSGEDYGEYSARQALSFTYREGDDSLDLIDGFAFLCCATVSKPLAQDRPDPTEQWFLMGDTDGRVTLYGRSNTTLYTSRRYGETFESVVAGGLMAFGQETIDKYIKRWTLLMSDSVNTGLMTFELYGARQSNDPPVLLGTKDMMNPVFPGVANIERRRAFFRYRLRCSVDGPVAFSGHVWLMAGQDIQQISQIAP